MDNGYSRAVDSGDILLVCTCEACTATPVFLAKTVVLLPKLIAMANMFALVQP